MYIDCIELQDFRTFRKASVDFLHPDQDPAALGMPRPKIGNVNLLLGNNGFGKTTLLKAIALACLGPAVGRSGIYPYRLVRQEPRAAGASSRAAKEERRCHRGGGARQVHAASAGSCAGRRGAAGVRCARAQEG
jgi:hypothetical protein